MKVIACRVLSTDFTTMFPLCTKSAHPDLNAPLSGIRRRSYWEL